MNKLTFILLFQSFFIFGQETYKGSIGLETQAQVDSFRINYPNVTQIEGNLYIKSKNGVEIKNLDSLFQIVSVGEYLFVLSNYQLKNVFGLKNLASVKNFHFTNNDLILSLDDVLNLSKIQEEIKISGNRRLKDISFLSKVEPSKKQKLTIMGNDALTQLSGVEHFDSLFYLDVSANDRLRNLNAFESLEFVDFCIYLSANRSLIDISALSKIESLEKLVVAFNSNLKEVNMLSLKGVSKELEITGNPSLQNIGFLNSLEIIPKERLWITSNKKLDNCQFESYCNIKNNTSIDIDFSKNSCDFKLNCN